MSNNLLNVSENVFSMKVADLNRIYVNCVIYFLYNELFLMD
jgi:hypothetical protein